MHICTKFEDNFGDTWTFRNPFVDLRLSSLTLTHSGYGQSEMESDLPEVPQPGSERAGSQTLACPLPPLQLGFFCQHHPALPL